MTLDERLEEYLDAREIELPHEITHAHKILKKTNKLIKTLTLNNQNNIQTKLTNIIHTITLITHNQNI